MEIGKISNTETCNTLFAGVEILFWILIICLMILCVWGIVAHIFHRPPSNEKLRAWLDGLITIKDNKLIDGKKLELVHVRFTDKGTTILYCTFGNGKVWLSLCYCPDYEEIKLNFVNDEDIKHLLRTHADKYIKYFGQPNELS